MIKNKMSEIEFEQFLVSEYFRKGSIDEVYKSLNYDLPISFAGYHRVLNKYEVIKSAGPNSKLSESLHVLSLLNDYKLPLERIYHKYAPQSFQVSTNTLHRILHLTRLGVTRRMGTALIIESPDYPGKYLLGQDVSLKNSGLGTKGDWSLPMGYTREQDSHQKSIKRVLQQEVFTDLTIQNRFPKKVLSQKINEIFTVNIADIKVSVYKLTLPKNLEFSSFKLQNHQYLSLLEIKNLKARPGVVDILEHFESQNRNNSIDSSLNRSLALVPLKAKIR